LSEPQGRASVYAVVVTHNRKRLLLECLESLASQDHPLLGALVVDNASTDGTLEYLRERRVADRLPIDYLRLARNGGGSEGFHYGVKHAREVGAEWIWLMDDDCEAPAGCLASLLEHERARDRGAALLAPIVTDPAGRILPLNRGWTRARWFISPIVGLSPEHVESSEVCIDHCSLAGPLVRTAAARAVDPPPRQFFIWWDDLEWSSRLRGTGDLWLLPASRLVHKDPRPAPDTSWSARWREFRDPQPFAQSWKRIYGLRNLIYCGRRDGFVNAGRALSYVLVASARALLFERPRLRSVRLLVRYASWGWNGIFRNVPPDRWGSLAHHPDPAGFIESQAIRYDRDTDGAPQLLAAT
jgi:GT2 family glycosyltransferase